jgi:ketosteroid isomerase-like protein
VPGGDPGLLRRHRFFAWKDLQLYATEDRALVFATARSEVVLRTGGQYRNEYCFMMRFRDGKLAEYREYFNPLPAIEAFALPD